MKFDVLADWTLNYYCNFTCPYCFLNKRIRRNKNNLGNPNIEKTISFFNRSNLTWLIHMSGGEPFLHPRFIELCLKLTKNHFISINTNLSINTVNNFIIQVNPKKVVFINCSLHFQERLKKHSIQLFIDQYIKLKKAGFNCYVTQVFNPSIVEDFNRIFNSFRKEGLIIQPKIFRGFFNEKHYPEAYTQKEKNSFLYYSNLAHKLEPISETHIDPSLDRKFIDGELSFKGTKCKAGKKFVYIKYNGDIVRCHASNKPLGNIFKGILELHRVFQLCPFPLCPCPYYGLRFTSKQPQIIKNVTPLRRIRHIVSGLLDNLNLWSYHL